MRVLYVVFLLFVFIPPAFAAQDIYVCPMHPHITGKKGDICPICGMTLVPKIDKIPQNSAHAMQGMDAQGKGGFSIDPSYVQTLGVKTAEVAQHEFGREIRAFGRIVPSTRLEYAVDVRAKGWIVDLAVSAVGDTVKKGDLLFTYYSPDLMTAQSDYLIGKRLGNAEQRLRLYGMDKKAIALLNKEGKMLEETPFYAPADGTVTMLSVRKGSHVNEGGNVVKLQDFSKLWVNAQVPVKDVQFLSIGTPATITEPQTGRTYKSTVDFIHPVNDPRSMTVTVRMVLDNPDGALKPDTYVDTVFDSDVKSRLAVPDQAILYGNMGAYVLENVRDGMFKPLMVKTGITAHGMTEITSGLKQGQRIVTSGQFMLDAESNLKSGMAGMEHGDDDMGGNMAGMENNNEQ